MAQKSTLEIPMPEQRNDPHKEPVREPTKKPEKKLPGDPSGLRRKEKRLGEPERTTSQDP